jgi:hypothetical protein
MPIVVDNVTMQPEAAPVTRSAEQSSTASSTTAPSSTVDAEKALRQMIERMVRVRAS